jgi:hypothetical protein
MELYSDHEIQMLTTNPFTKRLVENFNSLEDVVQTKNMMGITNDSLIRIKCRQMLSDIYNNILVLNEPPKKHSIVAICARDLVIIYARIEPCCDGLTLLCILYYYIQNMVIPKQDNSRFHTLFLNPLLNDPLFRHHICDPRIKQFLVTCVIHCNESIEYSTKTDRKLDSFYLDLHKTGREVYWDFLEDMAERTATYKEDLIAAAWHPKRVEKWLEVGGFELLEAL